MPLDAIETPEILDILEPIWRTKSETASRVRGRIERILAAAAVRGLRPATNPAAWAGHLCEALPPKQKATSFAAMPYSEVPAFIGALRHREGVGARALEFAILTAARSGEARCSRWAEIDQSAKVWTVPGERMKAGRSHAVPLSDGAIRVLEEVKSLRDLSAGYVFPGSKGIGLSDMTLSKLIRSMGYDVVPHGFRASFKTWAEQESNHPNVVIEAALGHLVGNKAEQAYMRGDWLMKRRRLMEEWSVFCASVPSDGRPIS
jgi:integrase